jgi:putative two-component system response regulator
VDVYDALATTRPYKRALTVEEALAVMKKEVKKGWRDPNVFAEFERLIEKDVEKFISLVTAAAAGGN